MSIRFASCSCGQLSARVTGDPARNSICHCLTCQRRTGSPFAQQARFLRENVTITGQSTQYTRKGDEGSEATFHFCPHCGATVYYEGEILEPYLAIPVGAFADPEFPSPTVSVTNRECTDGWCPRPTPITSPEMRGEPGSPVL